MLLRQVEVGLRDLRGKHQSIMFVASGFSQLLELFRPEHFSQSIGRVHGAVDHDMGHGIPFDANSALSVWQSIRRPPMAAACEC